MSIGWRQRSSAGARELTPHTETEPVPSEFASPSPERPSAPADAAASDGATGPEALLQHDGFVRRVAAAVVPDAATADDVAQDTFVRALGSAPTEVRHPKAWLATIARNLARTFHTRRGARARREDVAAARRQPPSEPTEILAREELRQRVVRALLALEEPYRSVLTKRFYQDLPPREIAKEMDCPVETVRTWTKRGIVRLRMELDDRYGGDRRAWLGAMVPILLFEPPRMLRGKSPDDVSGGLGGRAVLAAAVLLVSMGGMVWWGGRSGASSVTEQTAQRHTPSGTQAVVPPPPQEVPTPKETRGRSPETRPTGLGVPRKADAKPNEETNSTPPPGEPAEEPKPKDAPRAPRPPIEPPKPEPPAPPPPAPQGKQPTGPLRRTAIVPPRVPTRDVLTPGVTRLSPRGMVRVPAGTAIIGTPKAQLARTFARHGPRFRARVAFEAPAHRVQMDAVFFDQDEVSNAQYAVFLHDTARQRYTVPAAGARTLDAIARAYGGPAAHPSEDDGWIGWQQVFVANLDSIRRALGDRFAEAAVSNAAGQLDLRATAKRLRHVPLPPGCVLHVCTRHVPDHWLGLVPAPSQADEPVRYVSYIDARDFAAWAGKLIPTEQRWEYVARGPEGHEYPWGAEMPGTKDAQLALANWRAGYVDDNHAPRPIPVGALPGGASWCGVRGLAGNVSEWTSSWFGPYPGYGAVTGPYATRVGETLKVIRGGNALTIDPLLLRSADRKFLEPQYVRARFAWVGIRLAWYRAPGRNHVAPLLTALSRGGYAAPGSFARTRLAGAVVEQFAKPGKGTVHVVGRTRALVVLPATSLLGSPTARPASTDRRAKAWKQPEPYRSVPRLLRKTHRAASPSLVVGAVRIDAPLVGGHTGDFLLALWKGRLCLCDRSLSFVTWAAPRTADALDMKIMTLPDPNTVPGALLALDTLADSAGLELIVPIGGLRTNPRLHLRIRGSLEFELGALDAAGTWRLK